MERLTIVLAMSASRPPTRNSRLQYSRIIVSGFARAELLSCQHCCDREFRYLRFEMDEPMAAAGAQLSGEHQKSETELALDRAAAREKHLK